MYLRMCIYVQVFFIYVRALSDTMHHYYVLHTISIYYIYKSDISNRLSMIAEICYTVDESTTSIRPRYRRRRQAVRRDAYSMEGDRLNYCLGPVSQPKRRETDQHRYRSHRERYAYISMILLYRIHVRSHDGSREAVCRFPTLLSSSISLGEWRRRCESNCEEKPENTTCRDLSKHI
jgi:hypothetical protein